MKLHRLAFAGLVALALAACSGGGGSGSGGGGYTPPTTPSPCPSGDTGTAPSCATPTPTYTVTGTVTELSAGTPLSGATVTVGTMPSATCAGYTQCAIPGPPTYTATTGSDGTFSVPSVPNGDYLITVGLDANPTVSQTYAILHRKITLSGTTLALESIKLSKLSSVESAWIAGVNSDRATISYPATSPIAIDEYAEEQARAEATAVVNGAAYGDATESVYAQAYGQEPGAPFSAGGVSDANFGPDQWQSAEASWFNEKANCPNGDWRTCAWAENTGHYINMSQDSDILIGLASSAQPADAASGVGGWYMYTGIPLFFGTSQRTATDSTRIAHALIGSRGRYAP